MNPQKTTKVHQLATLVLLCLCLHIPAVYAQSNNFSAILDKQAERTEPGTKQLSRAEILTRFHQPSKKNPSDITAGTAESEELAVKIWICPAVYKSAGEGLDSSQKVEPGSPVNPEEFAWKPGGVFFVRCKASKSVYLSLFYIKKGEKPQLFSPDAAYRETFNPIPPHQEWTSPPIALNNDEVPEILDWIAVTADSGILHSNLATAKVEIEVAVRAFLRSASENAHASAYAEAQATLVDKGEAEKLSQRLEEITKIIYGKTKDLPSTKMGYVVPEDAGDDPTQDELALLGFGPQGIVHGLLLFNKAND